MDTCVPPRTPLLNVDEDQVVNRYLATEHPNLSQSIYGSENVHVSDASWTLPFNIIKLPRKGEHEMLGILARVVGAGSHHELGGK